MKKVLENIKLNKWLLVSLFSGIVFFIPFFAFPYFGLLDDGFFVSRLMNLNMFDLNSYLDAGIGRAIPFTWIFNKIIFELAQYNALGVIVLRCIELLFTLYLMYKVVLLAGGKKKYAALAGILTAFTGAMVTNIYELGTQDHITFLLLLMFIYVYLKNAKKKAYTIASIVVLLAIFLTKEINFFMIFPFITVALYDRFWNKNWEWNRDLLYILLTIGGIALYVFSNTGIDSSLGNYDVTKTFAVAFEYVKILNVNVLPLLFIGWFLYKGIQNKQNIRTELFITAISVFSLAAYFPWGSAQRYVLPYIGCMYIVLAIVFSKIAYKKMHAYTLAGIFVINVYISLFFGVAYLGSRIGDGKVLAYLEDTKNEYNQVCVMGSIASPEDISEVSMWLHDIYAYDTTICTLASDDSSYIETFSELFDEKEIAYGEDLVIDENTIVVVKEYSFIPALTIDDVETYEEIAHLETHVPNVHPKRGFETKEFDWKVYKLK